MQHDERALTPEPPLPSLINPALTNPDAVPAGLALVLIACRAEDLESLRTASPEWARLLAHAVPAPPDRAPVPTPPRRHAAALTRRELEAALFAARQWSAAQIAERLFIAEKTVKYHLTSAYRKLGVRRKAELAPLRRALEREAADRAIGEEGLGKGPG